MNRLALLGALLLAVAIIATLPLRWGLVVMGFEAAGLSARAVEGRIWYGTLADATIRGARLGDTDAGLAFWPLLTGTARVVLTGPRLSGALERGGRRAGIGGMNGTMMMDRLAGLPVQALQFDGVDIGFADGQCRLARGRIVATAGGMLANEGSFAGVPHCEGAAVMLPLASASGQARLDLRIGADGRFVGTLALDGVDEALRLRLLAQGFAATPQGLALNVAGSL